MGLFDHYISPTSSATESSNPLRERIDAALKARGITPDEQGNFYPSQDFRQRIESSLSAARRSPSGASAAQSSGIDWKKVIGGIGRALGATGAGMRGDYDYIGRRLERAQLMGERKRRLELLEPQAVNRKFTQFFEIVKNYDIDAADLNKVAQAYIKANPELKKYLAAQGLNPEDLTIGRKGESITLHGRELKGGEFNDPLTGKPVAAGTYDLVGKWKSGKFVVTGLAASETKSPR